MAAKHGNRVTLTDVAKEVGVSVQLVSAVLNSSGPSTIGASHETKEKVRDAARRMGYRRNSGAASLKNQKHGRIGVLIDRETAGVFLPQNMLAAISDELSKARFGLVLDNAVLSNPDSRSHSRLISDDCVDALFIAPSSEPSSSFVKDLKKFNLPLVWLHRPLSKNSICFDESGAAAGLVKHLSEQGFKSIHFLDVNAPTEESRFAMERAQGFREACKEHRVDGQIHFEKRVPRPERASFFREWLMNHPNRHAVIVGSCTAAQVFLDVAIAEGRTVPDTLALATFDSGNLCSANAPTLTAAIFSESEFGRVAGEKAVMMVNKSVANFRSRVIECPVQVGGTTAKQ